jgi:hypothetical protein
MKQTFGYMRHLLDMRLSKCPRCGAQVGSAASLDEHAVLSLRRSDKKLIHLGTDIKAYYFSCHYCIDGSSTEWFELIHDKIGVVAVVTKYPDDRSSWDINEAFQSLQENLDEGQEEPLSQYYTAH